MKITKVESFLLQVPLPREIADRFLFINNGAPVFNAEGVRWREKQNG